MSDNESERGPDPSSPYFAGQASDRQWWDETGMCGGCGDEDCHPGKPCGDVEHWYDFATCDICRHRAAQGMPTRLIPSTGPTRGKRPDTAATARP